MSSLDRAINSAVATGVAEIITLPICTIKTVYQNTDSKSILQTVKHIYNTRGIPGFYKASVPAISSQIFSSSLKYVFYRKLEDENLPHTNKFINGALSGAMASIFTHPIDVIKVHWQMGDTLPIHSPKIFYRGYSKTITKATVSASLYFPLTDYFKTHTDNIAIASLCSAVISIMVTHPIDYLKTRHIYGLSLFEGWNPITYYKGLSLNMARILPHFVIMMTGIDLMEKYVTHSR
jgi:hypothetical protein